MDNYLKRAKLLKIQKEGVWKSYYANGQLKNLENWKNGQMNDSTYSYFKNGNMHSKVIFINGKENGRWIMYDSISGEIDSYLFYKNGIPIKAEKITIANILCN